MKRIVVSLFGILLCLCSQGASCETVDTAWLNGFVTADKGSIVNDGWWVTRTLSVMSVDGEARTSDGHAASEVVHYMKVDHPTAGALVVKSFFMKEWSAGYTDEIDSYIYKVTDEYVYSYGHYDVEDSENELFTKARRWPRYFNVDTSYTIDDGGSVTSQMIHSSPITIPTSALPVSPDLSGCYRTQYSSMGPGEGNSMVTIQGPGKGELLGYDCDFDYTSNPYPTGIEDVFWYTSVTAWQGNGVLPSDVSSYLASIRSIITSLTLPTSVVDAQQSTGIKCVVIPLN